MNKIAEILTQWFGSPPFIAFHVIWFSLWFPLGGSKELLTLIVSLEAIFLTLFILRAQIVAEKRNERNVKQDLAESKKILKELKHLYNTMQYKH